jgi:hypothetical protein
MEIRPHERLDGVRQAKMMSSVVNLHTYQGCTDRG